MTTLTPADPSQLRPLLHRTIDRLAEEDIAVLHRVLMHIERDRLVEELNAEFDNDRSSGKLRQLSQIIEEASEAIRSSRNSQA
jgi:hypothetical protein